MVLLKLMIIFIGFIMFARSFRSFVVYSFQDEKRYSYLIFTMLSSSIASIGLTLPTMISVYMTVIAVVTAIIGILVYLREEKDKRRNVSPEVADNFMKLSGNDDSDHSNSNNSDDYRDNSDVSAKKQC